MLVPFSLSVCCRVCSFLTFVDFVAGAGPEADAVAVDNVILLLIAVNCCQLLLIMLLLIAVDN